MVDFDFYTNRYLGSAISEADFPRLAAGAGAVLARFRRRYRVVSPGEEAEAMALCAMAEVLARQTQGGLRSASIGSVRVDYREEDANPEAALYRCAATYLDIYRGVGA